MNKGLEIDKEFLRYLVKTIDYNIKEGWTQRGIYLYRRKQVFLDYFQERWEEE